MKRIIILFCVFFAQGAYGMFKYFGGEPKSPDVAHVPSRLEGEVDPSYKPDGPSPEKDPVVGDDTRAPAQEPQGDAVQDQKGDTTPTDVGDDEDDVFDDAREETPQDAIDALFKPDTVRYWDTAQDSPEQVRYQKALGQLLADDPSKAGDTIDRETKKVLTATDVARDQQRSMLQAIVNAFAVFGPERVRDGVWLLRALRTRIATMGNPIGVFKQLGNLNLMTPREQMVHITTAFDRAMEYDQDQTVRRQILQDVEKAIDVYGLSSLMETMPDDVAQQLVENTDLDLDQVMLMDQLAQIALQNIGDPLPEHLSMAQRLALWFERSPLASVQEIGAKVRSRVATVFENKMTEFLARGKDMVATPANARALQARLKAMGDWMVSKGRLLQWIPDLYTSAKELSTFALENQASYLSWADGLKKTRVISEETYQGLIGLLNGMEAIQGITADAPLLEKVTAFIGVVGRGVESAGDMARQGEQRMNDILSSPQRAKDFGDLAETLRARKAVLEAAGDALKKETVAEREALISGLEDVDQQAVRKVVAKSLRRRSLLKRMLDWFKTSEETRISRALAALEQAQKDYDRARDQFVQKGLLTIGDDPYYTGNQGDIDALYAYYKERLNDPTFKAAKEKGAEKLKRNMLAKQQAWRHRYQAFLSSLATNYTMLDMLAKALTIDQVGTRLAMTEGLYAADSSTAPAEARTGLEKGIAAYGNLLFDGGEYRKALEESDVNFEAIEKLATDENLQALLNAWRNRKNKLLDDTFPEMRERFDAMISAAEAQGEKQKKLFQKIGER